MVERMKKKKKREQFLKVAVKLFSENGYSNVRLQQVADHSNCAYSLVYYYFKSKSDLFVAAVAYSVEQTISHYKHLTEKYDCPIDLIGHWFEVNILDSENLKFFVKIMMEYSQRRNEAEALAQSIDRFYEFETKVLSNSIQKGTDQGLFVCTNPEELAEFISCHIDGIYYRSLTRRGYDISDAILNLKKELWSILEYQKSSKALQKVEP